MFATIICDADFAEMCLPYGLFRQPPLGATHRIACSPSRYIPVSARASRVSLMAAVEIPTLAYQVTPSIPKPAEMLFTLDATAYLYEFAWNETRSIPTSVKQASVIFTSLTTEKQ